ncbi:MAG: outer membrane protein assembly factor BamA, partial [Desulfuromonadales bacterium C00003107]
MSRLLLFALILAMLVPQGAFAQLYQVGQVIIEGNRRVESRYIESVLNISEGQTVSAADIDLGLRNIYSTGRFDDVVAETVMAGELLHLVYRVTERPLLREVVFSGNHELDDEKLGTIINANAVDFYRPQVVTPAIRKIKQAYVMEGYYATEVVPQVDINDRNEVALTLKIEEGERVFVTDIRFEGNTVFTEKELKKLLFSKEKGFLTFITERGAYKEDMLLADRDVITDQYYNRGYIQVKVKKPITSLLDDKKSMEVLFEIEEGKQFRIGEIDVQGDLLGSKEVMLSGLTLRSGEVFSRKMLRENMKHLNDLYADEGYAFVNVSPVTDTDPFLQQINIVLNVERGVRVSIGRISVAGNTRTRDKVVRREMRLTEGDFYSASKMKNSRRRINNLGFFEEVNLTTGRGVDDAHMDVEVDVQEKATGSFSIGAGFSSADGLLLQGAVSQDNFLGRALRFDLSAALGGSSTTYRLGLLDPYFLDRHIAFGGDIYNTEREWTDFTRKTTGGDIKLGVPLTETMRTFFIYRYEKKDIYDVDEGAPPSIERQEGKSTLSSFTASLSR